MTSQEAKTGSRSAILARIRAGNRATGAAKVADAAWNEIPRFYHRQGNREGLDHEATLELLEDRLRDYDAHVVRTTAGDLPAAIEKMLSTRGYTRMLVPAGITVGTLPAGISFAVDAEAEPLSAMAIDKFEGVLSECTLAIAETGTIVLQSVPGQGRRVLSLVPDYHLCIVRAESVVNTVPEAMDRIASVPAFATTFISGPSATADIEMTRIKGVHGPRFLDVLLVTGGEPHGSTAMDSNERPTELGEI